MTGHLSPDEQVDALERTLAPDRLAHLETCAVCRDDVARMRAMAEAARAVDVPEPSPLFWPHQAARISAMVAAEPIARPRSTWAHAAWVGSAAAVAAVGLLVVHTGSRRVVSPVAAGRPAVVHSTASAAAASQDAADERLWSMVEDLGGEIDADAARAVLTPATGAADRALDDLDADEQAALARVLRTELKGKAG